MQQVITAVLWFCVGAVCSADTIQLTSGGTVNATVTRYKNSSFETRAADGKGTTYSSNNVKHIDFDSRGSARIVTRTNGVQEGTVTAFDKGAFAVTQPSGARTFSAIFVEQADFVPDRGQSIETITHGQQ